MSETRPEPLDGPRGMELATWPESAAFWDAAAEGRFVLQWCMSCAAPVHFPRVACPTCLGNDLEWRDASGRGVVYACTVVHTRGPARVRDRSPYVVALVELDEGVRFMTNVFGCPADDVHVGMRVCVTWEAVGDPHGRQLPVFEPDPSANAMESA